MAGNKIQIPEEFKSIEEIQHFWDRYSSADYWEEMKDVEMKLSPDLMLKIELKKLYKILNLTPKQIDEIEARAKKENLNSKQLIHKWISENI